ncbi:chemotaxis protein CheX [Magnetofaba australis]|uniref:Putative inhibitor of MCP methylation-like protein n=1 Tax=Magnetofaba australis IT-1 TaxID=1434232 RepID=A0A1Y2K5I7_9PROT|nr:chemotaxis protein CheX [Magnetofaba australis]OSM04813.1 putative inhibitor of MCP methylation-like protein [Magnetofaba australis IT-1]
MASEGLSAESFLIPLREAVQEIAETMLFVGVEPGPSDDESRHRKADFSAVVGYSGSIKGSMRLAAPDGGARELAGALLGEERESMDDEMQDAYAEMANMIAGGLQSRLEESIGHISLTPPVFIDGTGHSVRSDHSFACCSQDFTLESGETFLCEVYYRLEELEQSEVAQFGLAVVDQEDAGDTAQGAGMSEEQIKDAVREALAQKLNEILTDESRQQVRAALPDVAEKLIREEIERIEKEGL